MHGLRFQSRPPKPKSSLLIPEAWRSRDSSTGLSSLCLFSLHEFLRQFNTSSMDNIGHLFFSRPPSFNQYFIFHAVLLLLLYACAWRVCVRMCSIAHMWRSADNCVQWVLSVYLCEGPRDWAQVIRLAQQVPLPTEPSQCTLTNTLKARLDLRRRVRNLPT